MIEVILLRSNRVVARSEDNESEEQAMLAARTLWDDEMREASAYGLRRFLSLYFMVDGQHVLTVEGRRP